MAASALPQIADPDGWQMPALHSPPFSHKWEKVDRCASTETDEGQRMTTLIRPRYARLPSPARGRREARGIGLSANRRRLRLAAAFRAIRHPGLEPPHTPRWNSWAGSVVRLRSRHQYETRRKLAVSLVTALVG